MSLETTISADSLLAACDKAKAYQKGGGNLVGTRIKAEGHDFVLTTEADVRSFVTFAFVPAHADLKQAMRSKAQKWLGEAPKNGK